MLTIDVLAGVPHREPGDEPAGAATVEASQQLPAGCRLCAAAEGTAGDTPAHASAPLC